MSSAFRQFVGAVAFLTRVPMPARCVRAANGIAESVWAFPLVGAIIGGIAGAVFAAAALLRLPVSICSALAIGAQILLTGALHEDGLADVADGFGGGSTKTRKLEIMRDSAIGSYGTLALLIGFTLRVAALDALASADLVGEALVAAGAMSRGLMVGVAWWLPPARSDGLGFSAGRPESVKVAVAIAISMMAVVSLFHGRYLASVAPLCISTAAAAIIAMLAHRQIGGQTGDVLGATQQVSEVAMLIALVAVGR